MTPQNDPDYRAYVICTSPRSGSTLLCKLLAATGQAGKPKSYFHKPDLGCVANLSGSGENAFRDRQGPVDGSVRRRARKRVFRHWDLRLAAAKAQLRLPFSATRNIAPGRDAFGREIRSGLRQDAIHSPHARRQGRPGSVFCESKPDRSLAHGAERHRTGKAGTPWRTCLRRGTDPRAG